MSLGLRGDRGMARHNSVPSLGSKAVQFKFGRPNFAVRTPLQHVILGATALLRARVGSRKLLYRSLAHIFRAPGAPERSGDVVRCGCSSVTRLHVQYCAYRVLHLCTLRLQVQYCSKSGSPAHRSKLVPRKEKPDPLRRSRSRCLQASLDAIFFPKIGDA